MSVLSVISKSFGKTEKKILKLCLELGMCGQREFFYSPWPFIYCFTL